MAAVLWLIVAALAVGYWRIHRRVARAERILAGDRPPAPEPRKPTALEKIDARIAEVRKRRDTAWNRFTDHAEYHRLGGGLVKLQKRRAKLLEE